MTSKGQNIPINVGHSFRYREKQNTYEMQLRHKKCRWWLLLFLLPLLLLIQCHKDVTVVCIDADTGEPIAEQEVSLSYDAHFLFKSGFFTTESINMKQTTDESGKTVFRKVPCSVFSYLFYCMSDMTVSAKSECYSSASTTCNFHYTSEVELKMNPQHEDLYVKLVDKVTNDPLPRAVLVYTYVEDGEEHIDSVKANAKGVATIPQMYSCGVMKQLLGRCDGYEDTTKVNVPCQDLLELDDKNTLRLSPVKEKFKADIVMCIDCTGSMGSMLGTIKTNAMSIYNDIRRRCIEDGKEILSMRIKVIGFRDYSDFQPFMISPFYIMPKQEADFRTFVSGFVESGGGDGPEAGYGALCRAIQSEWSSEPDVRKVIILWTDTSSHPLSPTDPITDFSKLAAIWNDDMKKDSRRLIIFAPSDPTWTIIESGWVNAVRHDVNSGGGLREVDYEEILKTLSRSI